MVFDLKGKTALVTGSTQGIGKEIAKALRDAGATVFVHGKEFSQKLSESAEYVGTDKIVDAGLYERVCADRLFEHTGTGGVDTLILNASIQIKKPWDEFTEEEFDKHIFCNLKSSYFIIKNISII